MEQRNGIGQEGGGSLVQSENGEKVQLDGGNTILENAETVEIPVKKPEKRQIFIIVAIVAIIALVIGIGFFSIGNSKERRLQEQLDLGAKYIDELEYEEALAHYQIAIEINPLSADGYIGAAAAYQSMAEYNSSLEILAEGYRVSEEKDRILSDLAEYFDQYINILMSGERFDEIIELIEKYRGIPMDIDYDAVLEKAKDNVVLGETSLSEVRAVYGERPYAHSNLMNDDTIDTVYTCYGMLDTPIPAGHEEDEFGFIFATPVGDGLISKMAGHDEDLLFMGILHVGDSVEEVKELFGLYDLELADENIACEMDSGKKFLHSDYAFTWIDGNKRAVIRIEDKKIYGVDMDMIEPDKL